MANTAARVGSINVLFEVQFGRAVSGLNTLASTVEGTGKRTSNAVSGIDRNVLSLNRTLSSINARGLTGITVHALRANTAMDQLRGLALAAGVAMGGLVPATIGAGMVRTIDSAHRLSNQLRTVTKDTDDLRGTQDALFNVAQRSRSAFDATVTIYARTARATEHLGMSQEKLLRLTETVQKSFAIGGASAQEAQGAAIQLSQGIASNRFSGDEFRSVAENAPVLLQGMAKSLGVTIGKLREMAHEGQLTADVVTKAILGSSEAIDAAFDKTTSTIDQAWIKIGNAVTKYAMDSQGAGTASSALVTILDALSANISTVADSVLLLGAGLAAAFAGRALSGVKQYMASTSALAIASRDAAAETLKQARAEAAANATRLAGAKAQYMMVTQGVASEATRVKASRELHQANIANLASTKALAGATEVHSKALRSASLSGQAFAVAGKAASGAWAFIGGAFGAVMLAVSAALYLQQRDAANAAAMISQYADSISRARGETGEAVQSIRSLNSEIAASKSFSEAQRLVEIDKHAGNFTDAIERMRNAVSIWRTSLVDIGSMGLGNFMRLDGQIETLIDRFEKGEISAEELRAELDRLASANPSMAGAIANIQTLGNTADAARGQIEGLTVSYQQMLTLLGQTMNNFGFKDGGVGAKTSRPKSLQEQYREAFDLSARIGIPGITDETPKKLPTAKKTKQPKKTDAEKVAEKLADKLDELRNKGLTFNLDNVDKETVQAAESIGIADGKIKAFIASLKGEGTAPAELVAIKTELEKIAALEFGKKMDELREKTSTGLFSELDQEVITTARQFEVAEEKVQAFIAALRSGDLSAIPPEMAAIRVELEKITENERFSEFADQSSQAFGEFVKAGITGSASLEDAFSSLIDRLADLMVEMLVVQPIVEWLKNSMLGLGGGLGGGGVGSLISSLTMGLFHKGGDAASPQQFRTIDVAALPRFHTGKSGVGHGELMAVLQDTETVLTSRQTGRMADALGAAASQIKDTGVHVTVGISADKNGNLRPFVESVAQRQAAGVVQAAAPGIIKGSVSAVQSNARNRPGFFR